MVDEKYKYLIAVATSDEIVINQHFGRAKKFLIIALDEENQMYRIEKREVTPVCEGGDHNEKRLEETVKLFTDCKYVLVSRIGRGAACVLERFGIIPMELPGIIEESIQKLITYEELQKLIENYK
jgi:predicted Fe-Mo cluster-binding NifX family protein